MHPPYPGSWSKPQPCVCRQVDLNKAVLTRTIPPRGSQYQPQSSDIVYDLLKNRENYVCISHEKDEGVLMASVTGFIIKLYTRIREATLTRIAGKCAVPVVGNLFRPQCHIVGGPRLEGIIMEPVKYINYEDYVTLEQKEELKNEMINLVKKLHKEYEMIHGDITPYSFMRWNGELRLIHFRGGRLFSEDYRNTDEDFERTTAYLSPDKWNAFDESDCPRDPIEDWYALALVVYELYTGVKPFIMTEDFKHIFKSLYQRKMPDLTLVEDEATRIWIQEILRKGGAF
ncbi:hypothetical protein TWF506_006523 [Arthrobotrys conoides]|uniref:Protein kinase domain-containing protein n=1 Tax=Arthrobotrys conoides TaxID=74498 RepID=A0AAN8NC80_9PEZI